MSSFPKLAVLLLSIFSIVQAVNGQAVRPFSRLEKREACDAVPGHKPILADPANIEESTSSFLNPRSAEFVVNGTAVPNVPFDIGESYAGLLPISHSPGESRQLYFWFFPSTTPSANEEILIWFNGGPGCSSLLGLLTENGPFLWQSGTIAPVPNSYSWTNLTNVVWIEQPVGVGFTLGTPNITNEAELAQEFLGFWRNFITTFGMEGYTTYITGESYAGYYVPYIADAFISAEDDTYYKLGGIAINDPILGDSAIQEEIIMMPYVEYWRPLLNLNDSYYHTLWELDEYCNYSNYLETYFTFPPPAEPFPVLHVGQDISALDTPCNIFALIAYAALLSNPCFNVYHITDTCPFLYSPLGINGGLQTSPSSQPLYFNRSDVQAAINAPIGTNWQPCTNLNVFGGGGSGGGTQGNQSSDKSVGPAQDGVLQRVIEYTNNTLIGVGGLDFLLPANGTLFALQNMTWNGVKGFQQYPSEDFYVPYHTEYNPGRLSEAGLVGKWRTERGLTFYTVDLAGHQLPGYTPGAAYRMLEVLLGRVDNLGVVEGFTTQEAKR